MHHKNISAMQNIMSSEWFDDSAGVLADDIKGYLRKQWAKRNECDNV
jgi:hypothetical protein